MGRPPSAGPFFWPSPDAIPSVTSSRCSSVHSCSRHRFRPRARDQKRAVQHLRAGQEALQSERFDEAEREFKSAIDLDPLLELAHYGLGQTYMATRRYVEAVKAPTSRRATPSIAPRRIRSRTRSKASAGSTTDPIPARCPARGRVRARQDLRGQRHDQARRDRRPDPAARGHAPPRGSAAERPRHPRTSRSRSAAPTSVPAPSPTPSANGVRLCRPTRSLARRTTTSPSS